MRCKSCRSLPNSGDGPCQLIVLSVVFFAQPPSPPLGSTVRPPRAPMLKIELSVSVCSSPSFWRRMLDVSASTVEREWRYARAPGVSLGLRIGGSIWVSGDNFWQMCQSLGVLNRRNRFLVKHLRDVSRPTPDIENQGSFRSSTGRLQGARARPRCCEFHSRVLMAGCQRGGVEEFPTILDLGRRSR